MAKKLTIERYKLAHGKQHCDIFSDDLDIATVYEEEHVHLLAASPLMLEALEALMAVIRQSVLTPILTDKAAVQKAVDQANAALEAAKGE